MSNNFDRIASIAAIIISILTIFISIWAVNVSKEANRNVLELAHHPPISKPNIFLSTNYEDNIVQFYPNSNPLFLLYLYNGGDGPCLDMHIKTTDKVYLAVRPQQTFYKYTDIYGSINQNITSTGIICPNGDCNFFIMPPNSPLILDIQLYNTHDAPDTIDIHISCANMDDDREITVKIKK